MIEIEKNIPVPTGHANSKYGFHALEVWDSFIGDTKAAGAFQAYCRNHKWKIKKQRLGENKWRLWRAE